MKYYLAIFTIFLTLSNAIIIKCDDNLKSSDTETPTQQNIEKIKPKKIKTTTKPGLTDKKTIIPPTSLENTEKKKMKSQSPPAKTLSKKQELPKRTNTKLSTKTKSKSKDIIVEDIIEEDVATLVEYPVTSSISYYYPYFVKSNLISFADEIDIEYLSTSCSDDLCMYCDPISPTSCAKCVTGFFLYNGSCMSICPLGYYADTLRYKCVPDTSTVEIVYTKAYSIGSCVNACGFERIDCDCSPSCRLNGTCCTDFDLFDCPVVVEFFARKTKSEGDDCAEKNIGCKFCDKKKLIDTKEKVKKCNQCNEGYFLFEGRCFETCPERTIANNTNKICERKPLCDIENCGECANASTCKSCKNGYFKSGSQCLQRCPDGYRADRITWTCLEPPVFAWYWVYPSRSSCQNYCGIIVQEDWDCSCSTDCFYYGNCCQDIDYYCDEILFWRKSGNKLSKNNKMKNSANKPNPALPALPKNMPKELRKKTETKVEKKPASTTDFPKKTEKKTEEKSAPVNIPKKTEKKVEKKPVPPTDVPKKTEKRSGEKTIPTNVPKKTEKKTEEKNIPNNVPKKTEEKPEQKTLLTNIPKKTEEKPVAKRTNNENKNLDEDKKVSLKEKEKEKVKEKRTMEENNENNEEKEKKTEEKKEKKSK